ncbi:MAG: hypothetical protein IPN48_04985 [Sphingomonadales bacterium]|nr:hypothetical protein [Sphingomonadales bacterium]
MVQGVGKSMRPGSIQRQRNGASKYRVKMRDGADLGKGNGVLVWQLVGAGWD